MTRPICIHGRRLYQCIPCKGGGICEHERQRSQCKDCGGSQICEHNIQRSRCKICGGSEICIHEKRWSTCKICGGSEICIHEKRRSTCKKCGGASICIHERQRSKCKDCGGSAICEHERERSKCKICKDPIHLTILNWIKDSKKYDKNKNRYDEINYIDYDFCKDLVEESGKNCYYCDVELQYVHYNETLATIERLDNDIGHIKENCVIACRTCNIGRVGQRL